MRLGDEPSTAGFLDEAYRLEVEGAELYLELVGPPDAPVVFYLHGGPGYNSHSFRELMGDELQNYRMIYADQRGAGRSPADAGADLGVAALAGDVLSILDALSLPYATLLAHGFGATVAATVAARAPERAERLVWVNPWVDMPALATSLQREAARLQGAEAPPDDLPPEGRALQAGREVGGKRLFDALLFSRPGSRLRLEHADAESFVALQSAEGGGDAHVNTGFVNTGLVNTGLDDAHPSGEIWSLRADLSALQHPRPTVILVGKDDRSCYPAQAERVLQAAPHALFSLLEGAHYPWLEDPERFTDLLQQALALPASR